MCSKKLIQKIDNGEMLVVRKLHLLLALAIIVISFTTSYALTRNKVDDLEQSVSELEGNRTLILEIQANVKQLVEFTRLKYIELD